MKKTITYKGNIFTYTLHDCKDEGNGEKGYIAFVDLFKGCVTSTQGNSIRELEKQVKLAIKDWLKAETITNEERQELESLKSLVESRNFFFKTQADSITDEWVNEGFKNWENTLNSNTPLSPYDSMKLGFKAGIQYALKTQTEGE